nr:MAG TPA: hypothetical protein [Caudoviricetes sp.]
MNTFISTFLGWAFFLSAVFGWTFFLAFVVQRVQIMRKEYLVRKTQREHEEKMNVVSDTNPAFLAPKERRDYVLNHIEDGRFYVVLSPHHVGLTIVCAKRYDAEEHRLYCHAYLWIDAIGRYNLHVSGPRGIFDSRDFLGGKPLCIDSDRNPSIFVYEEENISPYLTERDYNDFVQSLQAAGFDWKIEKGKENVLGSCEYLLTETQVK